MRLHIAIFGRRNVGKSSVLNALTGQDVAIVSDVAGTTTDPVEKPMEMLPLGPVLFVDTAGFDDVGALGKLRTQRTAKVIERTDIALLVTEADAWSRYETTWTAELKKRRIPALVILNKTDVADPGPVANKVEQAGLRWTAMSATQGAGVLQAKQAIIQTVPDHWYKQAGILDDVVQENDAVVLVIPIDKEAPKGRIILPQVQTLRDVLDKRARAVVTNEIDLPHAIQALRTSPKVVITDSQAFEKVAEVTPLDIPMTSFSILFARYKGDLEALVAGARRIESLKENDKVLICEACTHHPIGDDIGRKKIPRWLRAKAGQGLQCDVVAGHDFPADLAEYALVIHCGACMFNRREMLSRMITCQEQGVPITNYGVVIACVHGILDRALTPFRRCAEVADVQDVHARPGEGAAPTQTQPADTTPHSCPHAFINREGDAILIKTLGEKEQQQLISMYLAYEPRNSFSGLPPTTDEACVQWVEGMVAAGTNLVALSFDKGVVGHAALFPMDEETCEMLVVVSQKQQKLGIGGELTRCSIQLAHELGFQAIRLNVEAGNHVARHLYEKCGFEYLTRGLLGELDMRLDLRRHTRAADVGVRKRTGPIAIAAPLSESGHHENQR